MNQSAEIKTPKASIEMEAVRMGHPSLQPIGGLMSVVSSPIEPGVERQPKTGFGQSLGNASGV